MATPPEAVRTQLALVGSAAAAELVTAAAEAPDEPLNAVLEALGLVVPAYYDAAGTLAVAWYEELRAESRPSTSYAPRIIGDPATDWIEREVAAFQTEIDLDIEAEMQRLLDEASALAEKEVARGFRDSITGNSRMDEDAIGWSRVARPGACKFCLMLSDKGAVYTEATADFAAHGNCNCAARPEFRNGEHGPEASVMQYLASTKRRSKKDRARLREYLNENFPDAPG